MPKIYLCFLWHMHQPFYKDLISGDYKMPWTRLHALKDYAGMVEILGEFPEVRQTFNLVPSLMVQVEEYASGQASDAHLRLALKAAESLTQAEQEYMLRNYLFVNPPRIVTRFPRYAELCHAWRAADRNPNRALRLFNTQMFRDLQVLSQVAWFDEAALARDPDLRGLIARGRDFTLDDQSLVANRQRDLLRRVLPVYEQYARSGQIEISTTPFYHPILPLVCDSGIAEVSHPYVPLPPRFRYPQDAREQLDRARRYCGERFGTMPVGLWPSEGSVSDEALAITAESGFRWAASDNGVLGRTLGRAASIDEMYRPWIWRQNGRELRLLFRDHYLSDLIGFVYSRVGAADAARDFLDRIRENCRGILASGRDAFLPIILDGENAWEFYDQNGRPFLRDLYRGIASDSSIQALTMSEALAKVEAAPLDRVFPGSWISANFDVWIGSEEDNRAWEFLLRARQTYDRALAQNPALPEHQKKLAYEELLIAEGSDWCWWYGPEHQSDFREDFDELYRAHLANVYRALGLHPPEELSRPLLKVKLAETHTPPSGPLKPVIDGEVTSYFEWLGAGIYRVDARAGAMHGKRFLIQQLLYGSDGQNLYLRVDFEPAAAATLPGVDAHLHIQPAGDSTRESFVVLRFAGGAVEPADMRLADPRCCAETAVTLAWRKTLEARLSLAALGAIPGHPLRLQLSLWRDGLPVDAVPQDGSLEISTAEPTDWPL